ncbi:MAG TPA: DUF2079 domain-containing protein, partial [Polyangiaceae bacterium]
MPRTDSAASGWSRGGIAALVAAELLAVEEGLLLAFAGDERGRYVAENHLSYSPTVTVTLPLAALVAAALVFIGGRRPWVSAHVRRVSLVASPLVALWTLPGLLQPNAFDAKPLALMILAALVATVLERTLAWTADEVPDALRVVMRRSRGWDVAAGASTLFYVLYATFLSVRLHQKGLSSVFDLGLFENLLYMTLHGRHGIALGGSYFGVHFEPILYAVLPLYALVPRTETLLAIQSFALGGAAVPLYLVARRWTGPSPAAFAVVFSYLTHPALHGPNFYDFHFLALSPFFVAWTAYFFVRRSPKLLALALFGALLCREDVALGLVLVGAGLFALRVQPKVAGAVALASLVWFVGVKFGWMRRYRVDSFSDYYAPLIRPGDAGFAGVAETLLTNPLYALSTLFSGEKLLLA